ncbi:glucan endo-1,3-beta-glucosidase 11 [Hibiscus syriacus]|uniref:Glucan endo-1,3-beta-glucosidase 11 n=1 Tax=Hibiscus syriacus TaxID=106335 RepID=A0A6A2X9T2_HIBSY|nr:glucan endo-1,3-beta-glucosidase 11 [Hibiscus syriacus]
MAEELAQDLEELKQLQCIAKRPRILSFISSEIPNLKKGGPFFFLDIEIKGSTVNPVLSYVTLASFSWDQDNDKVKIYVSLEGVEQEKIQADFKPTSFDVNVKGKSYRCAIPKLNKEIELEKCKLKPNLDNKRDPMAGIMDLMKNMYEEGDEDMKRTIAKA